jgi:hypothetical protein
MMSAGIMMSSMRMVRISEKSLLSNSPEHFELVSESPTELLRGEAGNILPLLHLT